MLGMLVMKMIDDEAEVDDPDEAEVEDEDEAEVDDPDEAEVEDEDEVEVEDEDEDDGDDFLYAVKSDGDTCDGDDDSSDRFGMFHRNYERSLAAPVRKVMSKQTERRYVFGFD